LFFFFGQKEGFMKKCLVAPGFIFFLCVMSTCEKQATKPRFLNTQVRFVPAVDDTVIAERGIDAVAESDAIQLQWQRQSELNEYRLYRKSREEEQFSELAVLTERDTLYLDSQNLQISLRYYYYLVGANHEGQVTQPSDTVHYMLLPKPTNLAQALQQDNLYFYWQPAPQPLADMYLLKFFEDATQRLIWISKIPSYRIAEENIRYNWDGGARLAKLASGQKYRWRVDAIGSEAYSGSESHWQKFTAP
jgi:hypothetical protein